MVKTITVDTWTEFKTLLAQKNANIQEQDDNATHFNVFFIENDTAYLYSVDKGVPAENDDYVNNFQAGANDPTTDPIVIEGPSGNQAEVTAQNELKVAGTFDLDTQDRHTEIVNEWDNRNTDRDKIEYTVPVGKVLYIQGFLISTMEAKVYAELQADGVAVASLAIDKDGTNTSQTNLDPAAPLGPYAAGVVIRIRREQGDSGKNWTANLHGYTEDA